VRDRVAGMEDLSRYKYKALVITGLGTFMGTLDASIVNVSLPTISRDFGTTVGVVGWVVLSYALAVFPLLMIFGAMSEKKGFQFSYRYGYLIFLVGSVLCGLATGIYMLIISRVIQGIGAALLVSVGPALVSRSFPAEERGRGLSIIAIVVSAGLMLGPPLGGFIIGLAGWRWIFFVNVPVCFLGYYFTIRYISDFPITDPEKKVSFPGGLTLSPGMFLLMLSLLLFSRGVFGLYTVLALLGVSGLLFGLFFYFESKPETRLIGLDIFKNRVFTFSGAAMLLVFISLISVTILMPFYLEQVRGKSPQEVGLFLMIIPLCGFFVAPLAGYLADRFQARLISSIGVALIAAGILLIRQLEAASSVTDIIVALIVIGIGMALFSTPNTSSIMGSVSKMQLGSAAGILVTIRTLGITLGVGFSISIFSFYRDRYPGAGVSEFSAFIYAYRTVYEIMLYIVVLGIVFSLVRGRNLNSR